MNSLYITGASGFIGKHLVLELIARGYRKLTLIQRSSSIFEGLNYFHIDALSDQCDFSGLFCRDSVVIHSAALAHLRNDNLANSLAEFRKVNVDATLNLARQSVASGVKRFVFISSVGVNGLNSSRPFKETDAEAPHDAYSISKYEAEVGLRQLADETGLEVVIIRPPLVYGGAASGNFRSLINLVSKSIPLPFGSVNNKRSMVYVGNLVDLIVRCIDHPAAANETFLVSDGNDVSLRSLLVLMRAAMGRSSRLVPVPVWLFKLAGALTGRRGIVDRLVGDLQVDSSKARSLLGWVPPYAVEQGIAATVADFMSKEQ